MKSTLTPDATTRRGRAVQAEIARLDKIQKGIKEHLAELKAQREAKG